MKHKIAQSIQKANKIAISSHIRPDADSIGSGLALYFMISQMGKEAHFCNIDHAPYPLTDLPGYEKIEFRQIYPENFDILILVEGGTEERTKQKNIHNYFTINIDHHSTSTNNADINWIIPTASATGELIYELGLELGIKFTREIEFNLYAAIASDTGSYKYSNTTYKSLLIASELVKKGHFSPVEVSNLLFNSNLPEKIQLIPKVLATLELELDKKVAIIYFKKEFLPTLHLEEIETEDIISIARSIASVIVTLFFKEIEPNFYRISIRSKGDISSQQVAILFNGGGHDHAAGFFFRGDITSAKKEILKVIQNQLK